MPLKIPYYEMDIPRLVTALADWLACLLYLRFLPPRYGGVKACGAVRWCIGGIGISTLWPQTAFDGWRFNVLYAVSVALMLLFMAAATRADPLAGGVFLHAGVYSGGFAGALTWQMYVYFARYIAALQKPACVGALYCGGVRHHLRPDVASGGWRQHGQHSV